MLNPSGINTQLTTYENYQKSPEPLGDNSCYLLKNNPREIITGKVALESIPRKNPRRPVNRQLFGNHKDQTLTTKTKKRKAPSNPALPFNEEEYSDYLIQHLFAIKGQKIGLSIGSNKYSKEGNMGILPTLSSQEKERMLILKESSPLLESILKRLDQDSQLYLIHASLFQMQHLDISNVGLIPNFSSFYKVFLEGEYVFGLTSERRFFSDLLKAYLEGQISETEKISFYENDPSMITSSVVIQIDQTPLKEILNATWKLFFLRTKKCLTENNLFTTKEINSREAVCTHPISPLFLSRPWSGIRFDTEVLKNFLKDDYTEMWSWIQRYDAPIFKKLTQETIVKVSEVLKKILKNPDFNFSLYNKSVPILRHSFAIEIAHDKSKKYEEIWSLLYKDLLTMTIKEDDTYDSIANEYDQSLPHLKEKNNNKILVPGDKICLLPPKRKKIVEFKYQHAYDLFPRLTYRQSEALRKRFFDVKLFIKNFFKLYNPPHSLIFAREWTSLICTPIHNSLTTQSMLSTLQINKDRMSDPEIYKKLREFIKNRYSCRVFLNLINAMYPLEADIMELSVMLGHNKYELENFSIEKNLKDIKIRYSPSSKIYQLSEFFISRFKMNCKGLNL